jgi:hypothetical protein
MEEVNQQMRNMNMLQSTPSTPQLPPTVELYSEQQIAQGSAEDIRQLYNRTETQALSIMRVWRNTKNVPNEIRQQLTDLDQLLGILISCWKVQFGRTVTQSQVNDEMHNKQVNPS